MREPEKDDEVTDGSGAAPAVNGASITATPPARLVQPASAGKKRAIRNSSARDLKEEADEELRRFQGDPRQRETRRRELARWRRINITIVVVILAGGTAAFGWAYYHDQMQKDEAEATVQREKDTAEIASGVETLNAGARLDAISSRLKALRQGRQYRNIGVKRQFGVDPETGLGQFEAYGIGLEPFVILGDPDRLRVTGLFQDFTLAKVGHSAATVTHTARMTGLQSESTEFCDVFEVVTPERIAALEQQEAELKKRFNEVRQAQK